MARGQEEEIGHVRVSKNGYSYTKILDEKGKPYWRLTHHIVAEKKLGRPLKEDERIAFVGKPSDLSPGNIVVKKKALPPLDRRIATIKDKIADLEDELDNLIAQKQKELKSSKK